MSDAEATPSVADAIKAAGGSRFHDPGDVVAHLLADGVDYGTADDVNTDGIALAVDALAKAKPHLVKRPMPDHSQGMASASTHGSPAEAFASFVQKANRF